MFATIQPVPCYPSPATVLYVNNVNVQPGTSASYQWWLQSTERANLTTGTINLTGDAYDAWGSSDEYLYEYTAQQLGLTIIKIVPDAPAPADTVPAVTEAVPAVDTAPAVVAPSAEPTVAGGNQ